MGEAMNEQIHKLAEQAGVRSIYFEGESIQKLAELIVQECVSIVAKRKDQAIEEEWNVDEAMSAAETDLLEHFGVEP
jgi:hypothetical protein